MRLSIHLAAIIFLLCVIIFDGILLVRYRVSAEEAKLDASLWRAAARTCPLYQTRAIPRWFSYAQFRSISI